MSDVSLIWSEILPLLMEDEGQTSRLCLSFCLPVRTADVSCVIVQSVNRSSICGHKGACSPKDFPNYCISLQCGCAFAQNVQ